MAEARTDAMVAPETAKTARKRGAAAPARNGRKRQEWGADPATLEAELVERILRKVQPLQIVLFGSRARGTHRPTSDVDLLVIMPNGADTRKVWDKVYDAVRGGLLPVDSVIATQEAIEQHGDLVGMVYRPALRDGRVLYDSRSGANGSPNAACTWEIQPVSQNLRLEETRSRMRRAARDLRSAETLLNAAYEDTGNACYLAQQAAEKALKAVLIFLQVQYPFTHKLDEIRNLIPPGWRVKRIRRDLTALSNWAVAARYPPGTDPPRDDAERAIALSRFIYLGVVRDLESRGLSLEE
jgi:HEPN domain-containing protein/predicted nucleotidyltransferase